MSKKHLKRSSKVKTRGYCNDIDPSTSAERSKELRGKTEKNNI